MAAIESSLILLHLPREFYLMDKMLVWTSVRTTYKMEKKYSVKSRFGCITQKTVLVLSSWNSLLHT